MLSENNWIKRVVVKNNPSIDSIEEIQYVLTFDAEEIQKVVNILTAVLVAGAQRAVREEAFIFLQKFKDIKGAIKKSIDDIDFKKMMERNFNAEL